MDRAGERQQLTAAGFGPWRMIFRLILIAAVLASLAFAAAPFFAFRALRADARDGDVEGLAELIDYPAVRASLRTQLADAPLGSAGPAPSIWNDPLGAVRRAIEPLRPAPPAVDLYVSLDGLRALTAGREPGKQAPGSGPARTTVRYWGPNRVRFAVAAQAAPSREIVFTFQRRGPLEWRLVGVGLPPRSGG